ncbi:MAG: hypothetical protein NUW08_01385 [Candidatus Uhrbacteria bacterium]|nr:hypothetical protein [Candidatus Uhrbacteria bacterium]
MDVLWLCVLLALGALFSPPIGPICVRMVHFLCGMLQGRSSLRREPAEPLLPTMHDTAYRDSKDARIRSLERRNEELEEELAGTKREVEQRGEIIEELWFRMNGVERKPTSIARTNPRSQEQFGQAALGAGLCCLLAAEFVGASLAMIPMPTDGPAMGARRSPPPTMIDLPMLTSDGEILVPERLYVIVLIASPYDYDAVRCFEGPLVLEPTFTIVDLASEREWLRVVWFLTTFESDPPTPYLQL